MYYFLFEGTLKILFSYVKLLSKSLKQLWLKKRINNNVWCKNKIIAN